MFILFISAYQARIGKGVLTLKKHTYVHFSFNINLIRPYKSQKFCTKVFVCVLYRYIDFTYCLKFHTKNCCWLYIYLLLLQKHIHFLFLVVCLYSHFQVLIAKLFSFLFLTRIVCPCCHPTYIMEKISQWQVNIHI